MQLTNMLSQTCMKSNVCPQKQPIIYRNASQLTEATVKTARGPRSIPSTTSNSSSTAAFSFRQLVASKFAYLNYSSLLMETKAAPQATAGTRAPPRTSPAQFRSYSAQRRRRIPPLNLISSSRPLSPSCRKRLSRMVSRSNYFSYKQRFNGPSSAVLADNGGVNVADGELMFSKEFCWRRLRRTGVCESLRWQYFSIMLVSVCSCVLLLNTLTVEKVDNLVVSTYMHT